MHQVRLEQLPGRHNWCCKFSNTCLTPIKTRVCKQVLRMSNKTRVEHLVTTRVIIGVVENFQTRV